MQKRITDPVYKNKVKCMGCSFTAYDIEGVDRHQERTKHVGVESF